MTRIGGLIAALAGIALASVASAEELVVVDEANSPYTYAKADQAAGIYPSIVRSVFERMGEKVTIVAYPWRRAVSMIDQGVAGIAGIYSTPERLSRYDYSKPIFTESVYLYTPVDASFPFAAMPDLAGRRIGVALGWSYGVEFDTARKNGLFKTEENMTDELNFGKLAAHRLDAALAPELEGDLVIAKLGLVGRLTRLPVPLTTQPTHLAFNKAADKRELLKRFNKALEQLRRDGSFDRLVAAAIAE